LLPFLLNISTRYTLNHYIELFTRRPFWRYLNSAFVSIVSTFVSLAIGAPAAYALARLRPRWKVSLAGVLIVTLFPGILLFQIVEIIQALHLANNYLALIISTPRSICC